MKKYTKKPYSIRFTEIEYKAISEKAKKNNKTISEYITSNTIPKNISRSYKRSLIPIKVHIQQSLNILNEYLTKHPDIDPVIYDEVKNLSKECNNLWEN